MSNKNSKKTNIPDFYENKMIKNAQFITNQYQPIIDTVQQCQTIINEYQPVIDQYQSIISKYQPMIDTIQQYQNLFPDINTIFDFQIKSFEILTDPKIHKVINDYANIHEIFNTQINLINNLLKTYNTLNPSILTHLESLYDETNSCIREFDVTVGADINCVAIKNDIKEALSYINKSPLINEEYSNSFKDILKKSNTFCNEYDALLKTLISLIVGIFIPLLVAYMNNNQPSIDINIDIDKIINITNTLDNHLEEFIDLNNF